jgi:hypothetical protein
LNDRSCYISSDYLMTGAIYEKKFDGQQFYQYQQNEQSPDIQ